MSSGPGCGVLLAVDPAEQSGSTVFRWLARRPPVTQAGHDKSVLIKLDTGAVWASQRARRRETRAAAASRPGAPEEREA
ncbi:hypothetical protein [Myxococcus xanthus]|uniref:hypothetical protein n=1 Tax=Myxococcus xanthus TaxID=34 RepID=UPI0020A2B26C|nr:hypothetical protein [Myxococcus xanthus]